MGIEDVGKPRGVTADGGGKEEEAAGGEGIGGRGKGAEKG